jgi:hypothetical protein
MGLRIFLGAMSLMWLGYGAWCFANPDYLREAAGIAAISVTGHVDLRATYGGLQMAVGAVLLAGALRAGFTRTALAVYGVVCAGLGSARLAGALMESEWSSYTTFALGLELGSALLALALLSRSRPA